MLHLCCSHKILCLNKYNTLKCGDRFHVLLKQGKHIKLMRKSYDKIQVIPNMREHYENQG
jgi:hypothetical protein